jgi:hypothetical protein
LLLLLLLLGTRLAMLRDLKWSASMSGLTSPCTRRTDLRHHVVPLNRYSCSLLEMGDIMGRCHLQVIVRMKNRLTSRVLSNETCKNRKKKSERKKIK